MKPYCTVCLQSDATADLIDVGGFSGRGHQETHDCFVSGAVIRSAHPALIATQCSQPPF